MGFRMLLVLAVFFATLAGCASVMPLDGGSVEDHETTLSRCGVGNYLFRDPALRCSPPDR